VKEARLQRSVTLPFLVFYGVGTIVGGGFYALLGKVAGEAGMYAPVALLVTGLLALLISLSFAEVSSRFPVSAGEARYVQEGFGRTWLASAVGWMVILTGVVSAAALAVATTGFLLDMVEFPRALGIVVLVLLMGGVAAWGIGQSVAVVTLITVIECGALAYAAWAADAGVAEFTARWSELVPPMEPAVWAGIFSGAFLAFYAFIGFEDMVNIAEEVRDVRRVLPIALVASVLTATLLYLWVGVAAVLSVSPDELAAANTPLATIVQGEGWYASTGMRLVSLLTGVNGALVQVIMAARVAYGLARRDQAPGWLGKVNPATRTPVRATVAVTGVVLALALFFPLTTLARVTSSIILVVFALVCLSLWRITQRDPDRAGEGPRFPRWVPLAGALTCTAALVGGLWQWLA